MTASLQRNAFSFLIFTSLQESSVIRRVPVTPPPCNPLFHSLAVLIQLCYFKVDQITQGQPFPVISSRFSIRTSVWLHFTSSPYTIVIHCNIHIWLFAVYFVILFTVSVLGCKIVLLFCDLSVIMQWILLLFYIFCLQTTVLINELSLLLSL